MNTQVSSRLICSPQSSGDETNHTLTLNSPDNLNNIVSTSPAQKWRAGRKKFKEKRHPIFHGVRERSDSGKWVCEVHEPNKKSRIWLGTYSTAELAARAHDVAALTLRGDKATLNFPDSAWLVPRAKSISARDIRLAALQATRSDFQSFSSSCQNDHKSEIMDESSPNNEGKSLKEGVENKYNEFSYFDEEAIFNMPTFIDSMAVGMLLTPPSLKRGYNWNNEMDEDGTKCYFDMNLWQ
ncbi:dehydration-responsive element-binding protein 1B-like [Amaranthus tricolor]|uniref:dehydration-responsive element-binding protein 1B-like n=1 Tax=Amaranthus tricolor TaxID=29722 RepID=UPI00258BD3E9|nr:dehydration-responsive element-binding protein 1B-like [Amaranthus tricolor]